jgi:hypothetical protein
MVFCPGEKLHALTLKQQPDFSTATPIYINNPEPIAFS